MLDGYVRQKIDPALDRLGAVLAGQGVSANTVTLAGFGLGLISAILIWQQWYLSALVFLLLSRLADGLDGCVARVTGATDLGGYLDIVLDFAFYGLIPFAFVLADPQQNAIAGGLLIVSFYINGASFLAYATMAEKRSLSTDRRGSKSLYFTTGLAEGTETILVFVAFCLFPGHFPVIAYIFAFVCFYTALSRIVQAVAEFGE